MKISADPSLVFNIYLLMYRQSYVTDDRDSSQLIFLCINFLRGSKSDLFPFSPFLSVSLILITGGGGGEGLRSLFLLGGYV